MLNEKKIFRLLFIQRTAIKINIAKMRHLTYIFGGKYKCIRIQTYVLYIYTITRMSRTSVIKTYYSKIIPEALPKSNIMSKNIEIN